MEGLARLRDGWQGSASASVAINGALDAIGLDENYVAAAVASFREGTAPKKSIVVKDSIWGMIEVDGASVRLLDTPLLQRLRGIKQLGLSYITYPSAEHSRFIHSLGMYCVVSRFLEAISRRARMAPDEAGDYDPEKLTFLEPDDLTKELNLDLRHAALLHDVGHMPFSHVTEQIFEANGSEFLCASLRVSELMREARRLLRKEISFSECLSLMLVLSARFERLYCEYIRPGSREALLRIASLIAGLPPEPAHSGVANIDADKVDYINRDSEACGIPVGIDVARIFLRSGFVRLSREQLRDLKLSQVGTDYEVHFVVNASGMDTIDELAQARASLYHRVYLHPVTLTAQRLLGQALEANATHGAGDPAIVDAFNIWAMSDFGLLVALSRSSFSPVRSLGNRLLGRRLPKKGAVVSPQAMGIHFPLHDIFPRMSSEAIDAIVKQVTGAELEALGHRKLVGQRLRDLENAIRAETKVLATAVASIQAELVPNRESELLAVVGLAYMDAPKKDCIILQNGEPFYTSDDTNVDEQGDAYDIFKSAAYVMADEPWRPFVAVASRKVLYRHVYGPEPVPLPIPALEGANSQNVIVTLLGRPIVNAAQLVRRAGISRLTLARITSAASEARYFDDAPLLADLSATQSKACESLAVRLANFEGQASWRVTGNSAKAFLLQFLPRHREELIEVLQRIVFLDRLEVTSSIFAILKRHFADQNIDIAALSPSSGHHVRNLVKQEVGTIADASRWTFANDIRECLADDRVTQPLVLVDDNINSATQARAQFLAWAGVPRETWPLSLQKEDGITTAELSLHELSRMKARKIWVVTCAGTQRANEPLRACLAELGFSGYQQVVYSRSIEDTATWSPELRVYLTDIGRGLIATSRYGRPFSDLPEDARKDCDDKAFGYGNIGGLLATALNVPTATTTVVWSPGIYEGRPWLPLMIRQNKLGKLTIG